MNAATVLLKTTGCWRFHGWVAPGTIRSLANGIPVASSLDRGTLARSSDPQRTSVDTAIPAQLGTQIEPAELGESGHVGALTAPSKILAGGLLVLRPLARVGALEHPCEERLRSYPRDRPLQRKPPRRTSESAREYETAHLSGVLEIGEQRHDRPA